ncbi:hypothetical protein A2862_01550 [Candidatus Roizmanbacteria bacterium RIFCSPHIGHO2_01_FULL_38_41]|uniref:YbaK/aminoacyl-tRNA synthetase-associated domain-containing protein n=1 Tax=Candidatus Roizmanbacteria bacterium RIFCSPHIGHO2_02_FULL_37_24 TaxID=1802037 RepID=A0A1F7GV32_9BACT|nr:MAG: hypothetical protein A2862_01550 [Candidatus Roizmanbacteria bacterium RIFCSPHIGHO2_01_FULL_38_41]OGK22890.1 MAG: hypothetical protein A3C24_03430 [Candidatus Roizmanbacteria bacterium RIFCSPHIGHO2_02_FULL_37_24]OGK32445.1 MAG: hypothetical protein A3E10_03935 [Candidatus Roizmanbacteria bacterium RIFCSPHIGHO2_12_FULL_37_23]OGK44620.1 MAG: hypothetical protein A2956_03845 [Candidatus Roizmanbacteria bacterium RIFCSPLOWO2_01_FULL_37_57]
MKTFEIITEKLKSANFPFEEVTFKDVVVSARTSDTSVDNNYDPQSAIKTLVVKSNQGMFAVIARGNSFVDKHKLKDIIGKWSVVSGDVLQSELGYIPGCVCPLDVDVPLLLDQSALELEIWSIGVGAVDKGINVKKEDALQYIKDYKVVDVSSNEGR